MMATATNNSEHGGMMETNNSEHGTTMEEDVEENMMPVEIKFN